MTHAPATRIAAVLRAHGVNVTLAYFATFLVVGILATVLNEWIIARVPTRLALSSGLVPDPLN
jgi:hypothetical protein